MAAEDLIRIAEENLNAFNTGDWERFRATLTSDCLYEELATQRRIEGPDEILAVNQGWKRAFPDARGTLNSAVASGNTVVQEITWTGTNTGPMDMPTGAMPATGRPVTIRAAMVNTFEGERIKESHHYFDLMGMMEQLGMTTQQRRAA